MQPLPLQQPQQMILPVVQVNISFHIVLGVIRECTHYKEMHHYPDDVPCYLDVNTKLEQPVCVE
jgi:hypothetical protein